MQLNITLWNVRICTCQCARYSKSVHGVEVEFKNVLGCEIYLLVGDYVGVRCSSTWNRRCLLLCEVELLLHCKAVEVQNMHFGFVRLGNVPVYQNFILRLYCVVQYAEITYSLQDDTF